MEQTGLLYNLYTNCSECICKMYSIVPIHIKDEAQMKVGFLSSIKGGLVTSYCHTGFGVSTVLLTHQKHIYTSISNFTGVQGVPLVVC